MARLAALARHIALVAALIALTSTTFAQSPDTDDAEVRRVVDRFLANLGNRDVDAVSADLHSSLSIVVVRQRQGAWTSAARSRDEFLAQLKKDALSNAPKFQEPLKNVRVTIDSGHLAHVRADFDVIIDGKVNSSGVDHFVLVRDDDQRGAWKIAVVAYTSIQALGR